MEEALVVEVALVAAVVVDIVAVRMAIMDLVMMEAIFCIVRKNPQVPHIAQQVACHP